MSGKERRSGGAVGKTWSQLWESRMKAFVTGAAGMMGSHLLDFLADRDIEALGIDIVPRADFKACNPRATYVECDIRDEQKLSSVLAEFAPSIVVHLAAQAHPVISWAKPRYTTEVNVIGTINVFEIVKDHLPDTIIVNACSSAQYGFTQPHEVPVKETKRQQPLHPYGITKVAQELLAYQYLYNFQVKSVSLRIFNTTGPRKINDACSDWVRQLAKMEKGLQPPSLRVGNLDAKRAITDVRDLIEACWLSAHKGEVGAAYNVSGERVYRMGDIIPILRELTAISFDVAQDPVLMRPNDEEIVYGDSSSFRLRTGWEPKISLKQTLSDMLDYWMKTDDAGKTYQ
jgi:GDP-4-dehydro-6-deoxy-D-mannose reductase